MSKGAGALAPSWSFWHWDLMWKLNNSNPIVYVYWIFADFAELVFYSLCTGLFISVISRDTLVYCKLHSKSKYTLLDLSSTQRVAILR